MGKILLINTGPLEPDSNGQYSAGNKSVLLNKWAEAAADKLAEYKIDALYTCPVPDAPETASIIAVTFNLEVQTVAGLQGLSDTQWNIMEMQKDTAENYSDQKILTETGIKSPFGDNIEVVRNSTGSALDMLAESHKKQAIAIVSHQALSVIMVLHLLHMHNKHYWQVAQDAGAVSLFEVRFGVPSALYINDTCHLRGLI
ncbi:MAG: histidine phosphatase family protein [Chloroflexi bacterium]|nr:histidine phosphatase family protein [Chloroflexota bacterium]